MKYVDTLNKKQVERDFLTEEEMTRLIGAIDHELIQLVIRTLAYSGLCINECLNLTLDDIDFEKIIIHMINGKGGKD